MEKIIYFCKECQSAFGSEPTNKKITCGDCGRVLVKTNVSVSDWRLMSDEEKANKKKEFMNLSDNTYKASETVYGESSIGKSIKVMAYIFLALSMLGSFIIMSNSFAIGLASMLLSAMGCFLCIGIGEICNLLNSINNKLK